LPSLQRRAYLGLAMNENENQMTKARWEEMCLQHAALAALIGSVAKEVSQLRAIVVGLEQAKGTNLTYEDHTEPGIAQGMKAYGDILEALRKKPDLAEGPERS